MKTSIIIATIVASVCGCNDNIANSECNAILIDLTDSLTAISEFNSNQIRQSFLLNEDINSSSICMLASISDRRYNTYSIRKIEGQNDFEANIIERRHLIDSFFNSINNDILKIKSEKTGRNQSLICYAISNTIKNFNDCKSCGPRKINLYTDMMENSDVFSVYNSQQFKLLQTKPEEIYPILDYEFPIKNAKGIELIIHHQPLTSEEDERFYKVYSFFEKYYSLKGMIVKVDYEGL